MDESNQERHAYFAGMTERYQRACERDMVLIESLPLAFRAKTIMLNVMTSWYAMQRHCRMRDISLDEFRLADAVYMQLGDSEALKLAQMTGYAGSDNPAAVFLWIENLLDKIAEARGQT